MDSKDSSTSFNDWVKENKENLPLNIDYWEKNVYPSQTEMKLRPVSFGKYKGDDLQTDTFYKPISRIIILK